MKKTIAIMMAYVGFVSELLADSLLIALSSEIIILIGLIILVQEKW